MKLRLPRFVAAKIYRLTRQMHTGLEPVNPEELLEHPSDGFWAIPTFRYFSIWPWDNGRPRWLPAYATPDYTTSRANILPFPERRALNKDGPVEGLHGKLGDKIWVRRCERGAPVLDARYSAHGRQHSSDVWCLVEVPYCFLRPELHDDRNISFVWHNLERSFVAWVPAIWLARDPLYDDIRLL